MTRVLLVRHALAAGVAGKLPGRAQGVFLSAAGHEQARRLRESIAGMPIAAIYSSPRERARDTAAILAGARSEEIRIATELDELDYGDWTGATINDLESTPRWQAFNSIRSRTRIPNGESIVEVQARAVGFMEHLAERHMEQTVAVVTHGDVIRALLCYYLGLPLDLMLRLEISPASVTIIALEPQGPVVKCINHSEPLCRT